MRRIIVSIATSADGFIARPDGDVDWLDRPRPKDGYGMGAFYRSVDTVLLGRKTYDMARRHGQAAYPGKTNIVFSRRLRQARAPDVQVASGDVGAFARSLRGAGGKDVWLVGGAELIGEFLDAGQVDEIVIHVIPTLIGDGIPLLAPRHRRVPLDLLDIRRFADGVVRVHYAVREPPAPRPAGRRRSTRRRAEPAGP